MNDLRKKLQKNWTKTLYITIIHTMIRYNNTFNNSSRWYVINKKIHKNTSIKKQRRTFSVLVLIAVVQWATGSQIQRIRIPARRCRRHNVGRCVCLTAWDQGKPTARYDRPSGDAGLGGYAKATGRNATAEIRAAPADRTKQAGNSSCRHCPNPRARKSPRVNFTTIFLPSCDWKNYGKRFTQKMLEILSLLREKQQIQRKRWKTE